MDDAKKKGLLDFKEPDKTNSLVFAEAFFANIGSSSELLESTFQNTILSGYEDSNYTPSLKEIDEITKPARDEFRQHSQEWVQSQVDGKGLAVSIGELLERHSKREIEEVDAIQKLSSIFNFLNESPYWNGTSIQKHWHSARIESALYQMAKSQVEFVDKIYDQSNDIMDLSGEIMIARFAKDAPKTPSINDIEKCGQKQLEVTKDILETKDKLLEYALKVGFLFRDNWWLEKHGEAASEYYARVEGLLGQQSGRKTGAMKTRNKALELRKSCKILIEKAVSERGLAFAYAPTEIKAQTIRDIAKRDNGSEFEFKSGELLTLNWFKERIEDFSASGEIVQITEAILNKA
ncbi:MAG: hypothetical protein GQ535_12710 [Rhodobacteraceae bacterium]|nr:hypothetical protein [Paracoccaceae bacterium]